MRSRTTGSSPASDVKGTARIYSQASAENFPVASRILPRRVRRDLLAVYGVARLIDDIGDESSGDRNAALDWVEAQLHAANEGQASDPIVNALTPALRHGRVSLRHFLDLVDANRQDQRVARYQSFQELVGYCYLSAAPVGRIVLEVVGLSTPTRVALSDDVCIGLQIVEHLQDVKEDYLNGRVYLPQSDLSSSGATDATIERTSASPALRECISLETSRAHELLDSGTRLASTLPIRARIAICAFAAGGQAALDAIADARYDVLSVAAKPSTLRLLRRLVANFWASRNGSER